MSNYPTYYYHRHFNCRQCRAAELMWKKTPTSFRLKVPVPPSARYDHFSFLWGIFDCFPLSFSIEDSHDPVKTLCARVFWHLYFSLSFVRSWLLHSFGISMCVFASFHKHLYIFIHIFLYMLSCVLCACVFWHLCVLVSFSCSWLLHFFLTSMCIFINVCVYITYVYIYIVFKCVLASKCLCVIFSQLSLA